ncbi:MAG: Crp/Fnr family transcriptional regulator [Schleiferiaceae bacterium]|jgi:CRP-like cAMP-binding protein|nr:Crp/Fnr family transcriptional regulator [Bacteroidota bacterium]MDG1526908.1 Crp/Fnr family transcriptional regulator [Schleiferiaceae bacterium]
MKRWKMPRTKEQVIALRLAEMTGLPENFSDFIEFGAAFEGPFHFSPGENLWGSGQSAGYVWFIQAGYGFDKMDLEDGTTMLNGMIEPGLFVCDEKNLLWGELTASSAKMYTHATVYRLDAAQWRTFVYEHPEFRAILYRVNAHFLQMRKLRLIKMKHKDKRAYWEETKARFPGIELYCTQTEIASYFGVSKSTMHRIMK